jgi:hypothetical protein
LRLIEFQTALLSDNPNYDLNLETTQNLLEEKSTDLMSAIVSFFNSALIYLSNDFFGKLALLCKAEQCLVNLSRTALKGAQIYESGKVKLNSAIREFDQVIVHLTARIVAGIMNDTRVCSFKISNTSRTSVETESRTKHFYAGYRLRIGWSSRNCTT